MWGSTYSNRVKLALRVKGIAYEYIEEDLSNKSELLLKYIPVHKKVPVLVHSGKPIAESLIVLEYIDETWKSSPRLLPEDPYERAKVRFWASFIQELFDSLSRVIASEGEAQEKEAMDMIEKHKVFEARTKEFFKGNGPFTNGVNLGLLDFWTVATLGPYQLQEQVFGAKLLDPQETPFLFSWVSAFNDHPLVKEVYPLHDKILGLLQYINQNKSIYSSK